MVIEFNVVVVVKKMILS